MNVNQLIVTIGVCATAFVGCVSVDGMREQLQSSDKAQVSAAEQQVSTIVSTGVAGIQTIPASERIRYAQLLTNQDMLIKIAQAIMEQGPQYCGPDGVYFLSSDRSQTLAGVLELIKYDKPETSQTIVDDLQYIGGMDESLKKIVAAINDEGVLLKLAERTKNWRYPGMSKSGDSMPDVRKTPKGFSRGDYTETVEHTWYLINIAAVKRLVDVTKNQSVLIQIAAGKMGEQDLERDRKAFAKVTKISTADEVELLVSKQEYFDAVVEKTDKAVLVDYMLTRDGDRKRPAGSEEQNKKILEKIYDAPTLIKIAKESKSGWVRAMAKDSLKTCAAKVDIDSIIESEIKADEANWVWLAPVYKNKKRITEMASTRLDKAIKTGKENVINAAWNTYGGYIFNDEKLVAISTSQVLLRRKAFDRISSEEMKTRALAAIKAELQKQLEECGEKQGKLAGLIAEIGNGNDLIEWLKGKSGQTDMQNKETFAKMKGKNIALKGEVKNIGETMFSGKPYVSLRVAKVGLFEHIDVQFNFPEDKKGVIKIWMKGESRILRGKLNGTGDLEDDASCENGEVITEDAYWEAVELNDLMGDIKWQLKELDEKKIPPVRTKPSTFGRAMKTAAGWLKSGADDVKASGDDLQEAAEMLKSIFN